MFYKVSQFLVYYSNLATTYTSAPGCSSISEHNFMGSISLKCKVLALRVITVVEMSALWLGCGGCQGNPGEQGSLLLHPFSALFLSTLCLSLRLAWSFVTYMLSSLRNFVALLIRLQAYEL